jgi:thioesterase domain-containing protein
VAYYTASDANDQAMGAEELRAHLLARLPEYMVPTAYVRLERLPLTANGKLNRKGLPAPEQDAYAIRKYEAPRGEMETALAAIWADLLHIDIPHVSRHDNFFELGGHSLLAVQAVNLLQQVGITIPAASLFAHPTIQSLAVEIGLEGRRGLTERAIPIRRGNSERSLFLAHEANGQLLYVPWLTPHIDKSIPVYGLPPKLEDETPLRTVEGMAMRMVRMIRAVQARGPYRLAGWSFGGILAYEIAAQLIGADQDVEFLGLFDTSYVAGLSDPPLQPAGAPKDFKEQLFLRIESDSDWDENQRSAIGELKSTFATMDFATFVEKCREKMLLRGLFAKFTATQMQHFMVRRYTFEVANIRYRAQPIPIPVHLFAAMDNHEAVDHPLRGWDTVLSEAQIRVTPVAGSHLSMWDDANAKRLGEAFSGAIHNSAHERTPIQEKSYSALVPLEHGQNDKAPLFCVPGAGGSMTSFVDLASVLDKRSPIYGIQPRGIDGQLVPHSTVVAAADYYVQAIRKTYPNRRIHLLGHSFGGWVALEMALRLSEADRTVASLTIIDSKVPDAEPAIPREFTPDEAIREWVEVLELLLDRPLGIDFSDLNSRGEPAQRKLLHERMVSAGLISRRSQPDAIIGSLRTFTRCVRTRYVPNKIYAGPARLVLVEDNAVGTNANSLKQKEIVEGWRRWVADLRYAHAPGNHLTVLKLPHVHAVAQFVQQSLNES